MIYDEGTDDEWESDEPRPEPIQCKKCWAESPCVRWTRPKPQFFSFDDPPSPWDGWPSLYRCPSHGYIELHDGKQVFDDADCTVTGPDGKPMRMFEREREAK